MIVDRSTGRFVIRKPTSNQAANVGTVEYSLAMSQEREQEMDSRTCVHTVKPLLQEVKLLRKMALGSQLARNGQNLN